MINSTDQDCATLIAVRRVQGAVRRDLRTEECDPEPRKAAGERQEEASR